MARCITLNQVTVLSLLMFSSVLIFYTKMEPREEKRIHVLILSSWRSGSSFLGQIFNHHPNVFYLFEPARMVWVQMPNEKASVLQYPVRDLFRSLFTCDVTPLHDYLPHGGKYISILPFWSESRALCSPPACTSSAITDQYDRPTCFQRCGYVPLKKMAESCEAHSHVVLKTVRVLDLRSLLPLFQDPSLDLRVVHLVRDPRAVALSRIKFVNALDNEDRIVMRTNKQWKNEKTNPNVTQIMAEICKAQVEINEFGKNGDKVLQGKYMLVRHEDLAREPLTMVEKIYKHTGLNLNKDLERWLYNITHQQRPSQYGFMNFAENSMEIVHKWRKALNHTVVLEIQDACQKAIDMFGYNKVRTVKEQQDLNITVVTDMETNR